jgi:hypothetical protein
VTMQIRLVNTDHAVTTVDEEDLERVMQYEWSLHVDAWNSYAYRWDYVDGQRVRIHLHRFILNAPDGMKVDHADGNGLHNTRTNLRLATDSQSCANRGKWSGTSSQYKGVSFRKDKKARPWASYIRSGYLLKHLGLYATELEAAKAYDKAAAETFGEFARLNFPEDYA